MPTPRSLGKTARPIYTRIKRISLYPQHAALKSFFTELETLPNDIANEALLQAIGLGAEQALRDARRKVKRRGRGLPDVVDELQLSLLDASAE
jgi:hypothetical protein